MGSHNLIAKENSALLKREDVACNLAIPVHYYAPWCAQPREGR